MKSAETSGGGAFCLVDCDFGRWVCGGFKFSLIGEGNKYITALLLVAEDIL
jgi:hypothetical protein